MYFNLSSCYTTVSWSNISNIGVHVSHAVLCNISGYLEVIGAHFIDAGSWSGQGFIPETELQK